VGKIVHDGHGTIHDLRTLLTVTVGGRAAVAAIFKAGFWVGVVIAAIVSRGSSRGTGGRVS